MNYDKLPIYKVAFDLNVYIETIVKSFDRYYKYGIGNELRESARELLFAIHKANISKDKIEKLEYIRDNCENLKMLVFLSKELKAFKSFKQFENLSRILIDLCKQVQGWLNYARISK